MKLAVENAKEILQLKIDKDDANFARVLSAKQSLIASVLSAGVRLKDSGLHTRSENKLGHILDQLNREEEGQRLQP